jgi:23S rRNA pseudouridine1911/1915/1917 synthase
MAFIGCPIVGDTVYGKRRGTAGLDRQFLHAASLAFDQPRTGKRLKFSAPLPDDLTNLLAQLREKA